MKCLYLSHSSVSLVSLIISVSKWSVSYKAWIKASSCGRILGLRGSIWGRGQHSYPGGKYLSCLAKFLYHPESCLTANCDMSLQLLLLLVWYSVQTNTITVPLYSCVLVIRWLGRPRHIAEGWNQLVHLLQPRISATVILLHIHQRLLQLLLEAELRPGIDWGNKDMLGWWLVYMLGDHIAKGLRHSPLISSPDMASTTSRVNHNYVSKVGGVTNQA